MHTAQHMASASLGDHCQTEARVTELKGNKITFDVVVRVQKGGEWVQMGACTHKRAVIPIPASATRL